MNNKKDLISSEKNFEPKIVGVTIIDGTIGSKSINLKNILLSKIFEINGEIKVITVEDPPEYFIPGATQIPVIIDHSNKIK